MGSVCCCFCFEVEDSEEHTHINSSIYRHCFCLRCFATHFLHTYTSLFQRGEVRAIPSSVQGASASAGISGDSSISDTYRSPPRPLPYDDPRCSRLHRDGLISRRDKTSCHVHDESELLRRNNESEIESTSVTDKWNGSDYEGGSKLCLSEASLKQPSGDVKTGVTCMFASSEDEDVCPTCLEEYTTEDPKITMQCSHHFHLGCIYEWMERSEACPVCGKVMVFTERT